MSMKIALFTSVAGNGGSAATAFHTAKLLRDFGWETVLFAPGDYWPERGRKENIPVRSDLELRRGLHPVSFWRDMRALYRFLRDAHPDVLVVQKSPEQWLAFLTLHAVQRPVALVRMRGVVFPLRATFFNRWIHNGMERVICSARVIADQYKELERFNQNTVKVLHEGVNTERFKPAAEQEKAQARERLKLDGEAFYFGTAGRPSPVKGHDLLVRAFAEARPQLSSPAGPGVPRSVRLCIFSDESRRGPGSYPDLAPLCRELGMAEHVDLRPGFVEDMRDVYRALDAYVIPSRGSEGSSRAALEALASGLPLIATDVGVLPDLVLDRISGRLIAPDDQDALRDALIEMRRKWPAAREWGAEARRRMVKDFGEEPCADKLAKLLYEAAESAKAKAP